MKEYAETLTADHNITRRSWFFLDVDPDRSAGVASTDAQHAEDLAMAAAVRDYLREEHAWPDPVEVDSGNGAYLWYGVDLPNDDDAKRLITGALAALAARFGSGRIKIDRTVGNAARIARLPGTTNRKRDSTAEQPHRRCRVLARPDALKLVTRAA